MLEHVRPAKILITNETLLAYGLIAALLLIFCPHCSANQSALNFDFFADPSFCSSGGTGAGCGLVFGGADGGSFMSLVPTPGCSVDSTSAACFNTVSAQAGPLLGVIAGGPADCGCEDLFGAGGSIEIDLGGVIYNGTFEAGATGICSAFSEHDGCFFQGTFTLNGYLGEGHIGLFDADIQSAGVDFSGTPTPEPGTLLLLATGLLGLGPFLRGAFAHS